MAVTALLLSLWTSYKGVEVATSLEHRREGRQSLRVRGSSPKGQWCFAASPLFDIKPGARYRLSGWLEIASYAPGREPAYLSVSVFGGGKFTKAFLTEPYRLGELGTWQNLTAEFTAPEGNAFQGKVELCKRPKDADITADMFLEGVTLDQR
jgi:hypothetical protein